MNKFRRLGLITYREDEISVKASLTKLVANGGK